MPPDGTPDFASKATFSLLPGVSEEEAAVALAAIAAAAPPVLPPLEELDASRLPYRNAFIRRGGRRLILVFSDMRFVTCETSKFQLLRTMATTFPADDVLILRDDTRDTWYLAKADALKAGLHAFVREQRYESVCAFGSSSGGFAVLAFAAELPGFKAGVLLVPQGCMWELQRDRVTLPDCCSLLTSSLAHLYPARFDLLAPLHRLPPALAPGCIMWTYNTASPSDARLASHAELCLRECCGAPGGRSGSGSVVGLPRAVRFAPFAAAGVGHAPSIVARATPDWFADVVRPHFDNFSAATVRDDRPAGKVQTDEEATKAAAGCASPAMGGAGATISKATASDEDPA